MRKKGRKQRKGGHPLGRKEGRKEGSMDGWRKQVVRRLTSNGGNEDGGHRRKKEQSILNFRGEKCSIVLCRESEWDSNGN